MAVEWLLRKRRATMPVRIMKKYPLTIKAEKRMCVVRIDTFHHFFNEDDSNYLVIEHYEQFDDNETDGISRCIGGIE